jgi:hypothetical protein
VQFVMALKTIGSLQELDNEILIEIEAAEQRRREHLQTGDRHVESARKHLSSSVLSPTAAAASKAAQDAKSCLQMAIDNYKQADAMGDKKQELDGLALEIESAGAVDARMSSFN